MWLKDVIKHLFLTIKYYNIVKIGSGASISKRSTFEGANVIDSDSFFDGSMGYGSGIGKCSHIEGNIGRFTSIAPYTQTNRGVHPFTEPFVTTCPMFYSLRNQLGKRFATRQMFDEIKNPITVGNDCWIGQRVFIVGGVTIGDGAVILAQSVVTKDVPPYAIVGGAPARVIKYRYDEKTIDFLLDSKWWDNNLDWFKDNWELLCDINTFKEKYNYV